MKILFLTTHINTGGITSYLSSLAQGLIAEGHKIFLVSSGGDREKDLEGLGIQVIRLDIKTKSELSPKVYRAIGPICKVIRDEKIDIIHAHTRVTQVLGVIVSRFCGKPYVSTCHGFFKPRLSRKLFPCWGRQVIAISTQVQNHLINDLHVPAKTITVINNGIDLSEFTDINEEERILKRKELGLYSGPILGMIARLSDVKGQDILIHAMPEILRKVSSAKLLLVGQGKMEESWKSLVQGLGLEDEVIFLPVISKTAQILKALDLFVVPSRQEGFGLSAIEAMAMGLPVVASKVGGIPDIIEDGKTGFLVAAENSQELSRKIIEVLKDIAKAKRVALAGQSSVRKRFSLKEMTEKTLEVYKKCT